jgi:tRNA wybutosine-synthesizing protein 5
MQAEKDAEFVGAALEAGLRAARFSSPPSAEEFAASIEPKNVPAVTPPRLIFSKPSLPFRSH